MWLNFKPRLNYDFQVVEYVIVNFVLTHSFFQNSCLNPDIEYIIIAKLCAHIMLLFLLLLIIVIISI